MGPRGRLALRCASGAVLVGLLVLLLAKVEWAQVGHALGRAHLGWVLAAAVLNFGNLACKTARWSTMLGAVRRVGFGRLYYYLIVSYAASAVLPARAGEALRVYFLRRRDEIPVGDSVAIVVVEKLFEVLGLLVVVAPLPFFLVLPRWVEVSISIVAGGGLVALLVALILARRATTGSGALGSLVRGLACMREPSRVVLAIAWSVAAYLVDAGEVWLVLHALGIEAPWATPALVLLGGNLAIAIPSTPGQLGALEAGVVVALAAVGVPAAQALAFGLVYHIMQLIPIVLVGLSGFRLMMEARRAPLPEVAEPTTSAA
jgi:glycosyltransferase 2 family protein